MSKKSSMKPLAAALGTAVVTSLAMVPAAQADASPFGMTDLGSGYQVAMEGKCGGMKSDEGKCGGSKAKSDEGKCGQGKCGGAKKADEGKCGGAKKSDEGKCGQGKCGGSK